LPPRLGPLPKGGALQAAQALLELISATDQSTRT
jgi:hypothetical protein